MKVFFCKECTAPLSLNEPQEDERCTNCHAEMRDTGFIEGEFAEADAKIICIEGETGLESIEDDEDEES